MRDLADGHYSINKGELRLPGLCRASLLSFDIDDPVLPRLLEHLYEFRKGSRVHAVPLHSKKNAIEGESPVETR
jgi:hypothetical protein